MTIFKTKTEQQVIAEIHNEFDTAENRLLMEAENLLKELNIETETEMTQKADRLLRLGFTKASPVKWVKENSLIKTRDHAELIRYYKQTYPFNKFLTEGELERICKKYKLVFAPVSNYIKDVPNKNLEEIENLASLKFEDRPKDEVFTKVFYGFDVVGVNTVGAIRLGLPFKINDFAATFFKDIDNYLKMNYPQVASRNYICSRGEVHRINKQGLFICAPQSHFDLDGLKKQNKYSFMNTVITEVKDPIVFRYCRGGIQVITKWGLEAEDKVLVNEIMN